MKKLAIIFGFLFAPSITMAHVGYVIGDEAINTASGTDFKFLLSPVSEISNILLMAVIALITIGLVIYLPKTSWFDHWKNKIIKRLDTYGEFLPWIARLSLGIALLGAGTEGVLISPLTQAIPAYAFIEIILGFALLVGFLLVPTTLIAIIFYFVALINNFYVFGNFDFLALAVAFLALHSERPGFDDIFNFKLLYNLRLPRYLAPLILRIGIGVGMLFLAFYEKILNPHMSELVVNNYHLTSFVSVSPAMWVLSVGIIESVVAILLLIGWYTRLVSVVAFAILTLSFFYFKESVTSHVTLFGLISTLFIMGGGYLSIDEWIKKRRNIDSSNK